MFKCTKGSPVNIYTRLSGITLHYITISLGLEVTICKRVWHLDFLSVDLMKSDFLADCEILGYLNSILKEKVVCLLLL